MLNFVSSPGYASLQPVLCQQGCILTAPGTPIPIAVPENHATAFPTTIGVWRLHPPLVNSSARRLSGLPFRRVVHSAKCMKSGGARRAGCNAFEGGSWRTQPCRHHIHELMLHRVVHQLGVVSQAHFFEDAAAIGADGFDAQSQLAGDFADDPARGDQA